MTPNPQNPFNLTRMSAETDPAQPPEAKHPSRREAIWLAAILAVIALMGAAAYLGVRMGLLGGLAGQAPGPGSLPPGANGMGVQFNVTPAPELPAAPPDVVGMLARRDGGSLVVSQVMGSEQSLSSVDGPSASVGSGGVNSEKPPAGPDVEVVITKETKVYKDVTTFPEPGQSGQMEVHNLQQKLEPLDSLDDLQPDAGLRVWGERRGDRLIAQVVLFTPKIEFSN